MKLSVEVLSIRAKTFGFKISPLGKSRYRLTKDGVLLGGFQGKTNECMAFLDGWQAFKDL